MRRRVAVVDPQNPHVGGCAATCRRASLIVLMSDPALLEQLSSSGSVADQYRRIIMIATSSPTLSAEVIQELASAFQGELIQPGDPTYDEARKVWNGMIDRRPAMVARCRGVADVVACVKFAVDHGLLPAVRGGGHNVAGFGTCDGGLVIDLSAMRGVRVDPGRRTVRAEGGATWADLDREAQLFGLASPGGIVSTTGIAGLTLGGGQGWLRRTHGMACDNLVSADVVMADGRVLVASETEHA